MFIWKAANLRFKWRKLMQQPEGESISSLPVFFCVSQSVSAEPEKLGANKGARRKHFTIISEEKLDFKFASACGNNKTRVAAHEPLVGQSVNAESFVSLLLSLAVTGGVAAILSRWALSKYSTHPDENHSGRSVGLGAVFQLFLFNESPLIFCLRATPH
jgi:hypothetical protein